MRRRQTPKRSLVRYLGWADSRTRAPSRSPWGSSSRITGPRGTTKNARVGFSEETTRTCLSPRTFVDPEGKGRSKNNYKVRLHSLEAQGHIQADANASFLCTWVCSLRFILNTVSYKHQKEIEGNLPVHCLPA